MYPCNAFTHLEFVTLYLGRSRLFLIDPLFPPIPQLQQGIKCIVDAFESKHSGLVAEVAKWKQIANEGNKKVSRQHPTPPYSLFVREKKKKKC